MNWQIPRFQLVLGYYCYKLYKPLPKRPRFQYQPSEPITHRCEGEGVRFTCAAPPNRHWALITDICWDCRKSSKMAILPILHVVKSITYKHQIHRFRVFESLAMYHRFLIRLKTWCLSNKAGIISSHENLWYPLPPVLWLLVTLSAIYLSFRWHWKSGIKHTCNLVRLQLLAR